MGTLHDQVATVAHAPPPLFAVPPLKRPDDGKAFRALMVGGRLHTHRQLKALLLDDFAVALVTTHWHTDRARLPYEIPAGVEVMLIITTCISHELSNHARTLAAKAGIPYVGISTKRTSWDRPFENAGIFSPPRFGAPVAVPETVDLDTEKPVIRLPCADPFGAVLVTARKAAGLSQRALGELVGVQASTVSGWETGTQTPRFAYYRTMLDALPDLRQHAPPAALEGRTFETLAPSAEVIAAAAPALPAPPVHSPIELRALDLARAIQDAEIYKRQADDLMRAAEEALEKHKQALECAEHARLDMFELAKG